jgi:hypothetical protein
MQLGILPAPGQQLLTRADLDNTLADPDDNAVVHAHRAEAVRHQ